MKKKLMGIVLLTAIYAMVATGCAPPKHALPGPPPAPAAPGA